MKQSTRRKRGEGGEGGRVATEKGRNKVRHIRLKQSEVRRGDEREERKRKRGEREVRNKRSHHNRKLREHTKVANNRPDDGYYNALW
jgi:hypothetical protein